MWTLFTCTIPWELLQCSVVICAALSTSFGVLHAFDYNFSRISNEVVVVMKRNVLVYHGILSIGYITLSAFVFDFSSFCSPAAREVAVWTYFIQKLQLYRFFISKVAVFDSIDELSATRKWAYRWVNVVGGMSTTGFCLATMFEELHEEDRGGERVCVRVQRNDLHVTIIRCTVYFITVGDIGSFLFGTVLLFPALFLSKRKDTNDMIYYSVRIRNVLSMSFGFLSSFLFTVLIAIAIRENDSKLISKPAFFYSTVDAILNCIAINACFPLEHFGRVIGILCTCCRKQSVPGNNDNSNIGVLRKSCSSKVSAERMREEKRLQHFRLSSIFSGNEPTNSAKSKL
mmetsp:Transcript_30699/g.42913  ORF Transcript_30699/g.42913 Transcript_30699/m.42913 type:complete len:343 (-) Transcript_30699:478-1506(-)|eukprot:jgi/Bigna1/71977/fgenesh1_pg.17_\